MNVAITGLWSFLNQINVRFNLKDVGKLMSKGQVILLKTSKQF